MAHEGDLMKNQRRGKPVKQKCSHPKWSIIDVNEYDPITKTTVKVGKRCLDCKTFWKGK